MNGTSPQTYARVAGWLYLFIIVVALFTEIVVRGKLIVSGDATATAHNIVANEPLFRLAGGADVLVFVCDLALAWLLFVLLRPANADVSLLAAFFRLVYTAIVGANTIFHFAALLVLGSARYWSAFKTDQLNALAMLSLRAHGTGFNIALVFFGFHLLILGYLIFTSGYLPKIIGILLAIAGPCYVVNSLVNLVAPAFNLPPVLLLVGFVAELSLTVWLIVMGVNVPTWKKRARGVEAAET